MYKCGLCGEQSYPREKQVKVVLERYLKGNIKREVGAHPDCAEEHAAGRWNVVTREVMRHSRRLVNSLNDEEVDRVLAAKGHL